MTELRADEPTAAPQPEPAARPASRHGRPPARRALRGYDRTEVDRFLSRCAQALTPSGAQAHALDQIPHPRVTRDEVARVGFRWCWFGYHSGEIDRLLERLARVLPQPPSEARTDAGTRPVRPPAVLPAAWFGYATREVSAFLWLCQQAMGHRSAEVGLPASEPREGLRLAPEAVRGAVFSRGLRGFRMGPVDALLDDIEAWLHAHG
jgi:DivIVA domain-containing protein